MEFFLYALCAFALVLKRFFDVLILSSQFSSKKALRLRPPGEVRSFDSGVTRH